MATIDYDAGFKLFDWQEKVYHYPCQHKVVRVGRRAGKTEFGVRWIADDVIHTGEDALVVAKDYGMLGDTHAKYFEELLRPLLIAGLCRFNRTPSIMAFSFKNTGHLKGGRIMLRSAESPDRMRGLGKGLGRIWLDEFAFAPQQKYLYNEVLGPYQLDHPIDMLITSTPHGHDFFWELCERAKSPEYPTYQEFHYSSRANPIITEEAIKDLIKENEWGPIEIQENIEAEFADISAGVFGDYLAIAEDYNYPVKPQPGHTYLASVDLAQVEDWTVLYILDVTVRPAQVVHKLRFQKEDYTVVANVVVDETRKYNGAKAYVDATNERSFFNMIKQRITAAPIIFSTKTKPEMVQNLARMIQDQKFIYSQHDEDLRNELSVFRGKRMETGYVKYAAPQGYHDDCVASLMMLMWAARSRLAGGVTIPYQATAYSPMEDETKRIAAVNRFYEEQFKGG